MSLSRIVHTYHVLDLCDPHVAIHHARPARAPHQACMATASLLAPDKSRARVYHVTSMPNLAASQNHRITGMVSGWTPPAAPSSVLLLTQGRQASKPTITQQLMSIGGDHMPKPTISPSALSLEGFSESSKSIPSPDIERLLALFCYARPYRSGRRHVNRGRDKTGTYIRWTSGDLDKRVELPLAIVSDDGLIRMLNCWS
jgi:hypothetical protein